MNGGGERGVFVDTNVLIYAVDKLEGSKHELALRWMSSLWSSNAGRLSWQVLNEFYVNALRKSRLPAQNARDLVSSLTLWKPVGLGFGLVHRAWYWMDSAKISYWDALILASAETAGCAYLLSEDFQEGRKFHSITVVNPFHSLPEEFG